MIDKLEEKDRCNSLLYILTPNSKNLITETTNIINVVWESIVSDYGFVFIGVLEKEDITPDHKTQLDEFINLVKNISNGVSRIKIDYIKEVKEIFDL